jgi:hypothetical protein
MFHLTNGMLLFVVLVLILGVGVAARAFLGYRRGKSAPFRDYFGPEYDRDLLQQSSLSETEDWLADRHARFTPFRLRDPGTSQQRTRVSGATQLDRD